MVKLQIAAGKATPAPPVGTALGPQGVNIMDFCKNFNAKTAKDEGLIIPVVVTVYADRSYTFITKTPPAPVLLKRAANIAKGSAEPNKTKVGTVTAKQVEDIAKLKMPDLNASRSRRRSRPSPAPRARWASTSSDKSPKKPLQHRGHGGHGEIATWRRPPNAALSGKSWQAMPSARGARGTGAPGAGQREVKWERSRARLNHGRAHEKAR